MHLPDWGLFDAAEPERQRRLAARLLGLTRHHHEQCPGYRGLLDDRWRQGLPNPEMEVPDLVDFPWLQVRLFKHHNLSSIPQQTASHWLESSGTTGTAVSRVALNTEMARLQSRVLVRTLAEIRGMRRLPMLAIGSPVMGSKDQRMTARQIAQSGLSWFASRRFDCALDENLDEAALRGWVASLADSPALIFGFTWQIWLWLEQLRSRKIHLQLPAGSLLLHTGGWKKLVDRAISEADLLALAQSQLGPLRLINFYSMAEQAGSIFLQCEKGRLHCSAYNHVIVRDPLTGREAQAGRSGVVQVLSALPESYPGHSLLTEDLGEFSDAPCACGWQGRHFRILGRIPKVTLRGCANV